MLVIFVLDFLIVFILYTIYINRYIKILEKNNKININQ